MMTANTLLPGCSSALPAGGQAAAPNIVLTGFMGTGKTAVGRYLADRLGRQLVDLDELIEARASKSIQEIFAQDGESAFRALEAEACRELRRPAGLVVSTGGGTLLSAANREALAEGGTIICLEATVDAIVSRLADHSDRPLLAGRSRQERISALLAERAKAYAVLPHHLDTTHLSVPAVAEQAMGLLAGLPTGGHCIVVRHAGSHDDSYNILIATGLLAETGRHLKVAGLRASRCAVITNPIVAALHAQNLLDALTRADFEPLMMEAPEGEASKTLSTAAGLYDSLADRRLARDEPILALGGGVIGDMAGFVAATWLRGVPFVQIPTSLLAMVDASVGGKVGIDLAQGKNLVGAFKQPVLVMMDPALLATLPAVEFRCGMAEIIKTGIIGDAALIDRLEAGPRRVGSRAALQPNHNPMAEEELIAMIADAVRVKAEVVERDPFERGDRAWLNLGHTFGHALELVSGYSMRHGEAVALGLVAAAELSATLGLCDNMLRNRIRRLLGLWGLPLIHPFDIDAAMSAMLTDKKRRGRALRFVLIERLGRVAVVEGISDRLVRAAFEAIQAR